MKKAFFRENIRKFLEYKKLSWGEFLFYFFVLGLKVLGSIFGYIKKTFFWENVVYLILELKCSVFWNIRNFFLGRFFLFFELGLKSMPGSYFKCSNLDAWEFFKYATGSENASSSKYTRVLSIPFSKYKKVSFPEN